MEECQEGNLKATPPLGLTLKNAMVQNEGTFLSVAFSD